MSVLSVRSSLSAALLTVPNLAVYTDPGDVTDPPAVVLGLPMLTWDTYGNPYDGAPSPTEATMNIYLMVAADEYAANNLSALIESVANAVWTAAEFAVTRAVPGSFETSNVKLPAYVLTVVGPAD